MPCAGIHLRQIVPSAFSGKAPAVAGALQARVVEQKSDVISADLDVAFKGAITVTRGDAKGSQGVFWRELAGTSVGNPAWVGPSRQGRTRGVDGGHGAIWAGAGKNGLGWAMWHG